MKPSIYVNKVKMLLAQGKPTWGSGLADASDVLARFTVDTGIDFLWIDLEHRPYGCNEVKWVPIIARQAGCEPMVRVPSLDQGFIKKALDIGASCIMVPQVDNAQQARQAVEYSKYPPEGCRGVGALWVLVAGGSLPEYEQSANDEVCVVVQIETPEGIKNMDEICQVDGVDIVFAGPADLAATLGHLGNPDHPDVKQFLAQFPERVNQYGKHAGISVRGVEASAEAYQQGYRMIVIGSVVVSGSSALRCDLQALRKQSAGED